MIFGIGIDIVENERFLKWYKKTEMIKRFYADEEIIQTDSEELFCQHYASRWAVKEAFVKALGTGFSNFALKDIYIKNNEKGKPELKIVNSAEQALKDYCGTNYKLHVSISHEKNYSVAEVIIEK